MPHELDRGYRGTGSATPDGWVASDITRDLHREDAVIHIECAVPVQVARAAAWELLKRQVEAPQELAPRIVACEIVERGDDEVVRRVTFEEGNAVTERVMLVPEDEVVFRFVDHPKFDGAIHHCLFPVGDELWLAFRFQGEARAGVELAAVELEQVRDGFARAVRATARHMEQAKQADHQALGATT